MEPMISQNPWLEVETIPEPAAKLMLLAEVTDIFDFSIEWHSLPDGDDKRKVLEVIAVACESADLTECLEVIKLSHSRLRNWIKRAVNCDLEDRSSCPKLSPSKITVEESGAMKLWVTSKEFAHFPVRALADHAKKIGEIYCSATSWSRLIKKNG
jgi:putative transposase